MTTKPSPFKNEWIKCQAVHFESLVKQDDFKNLVTFYSSLLENNILPLLGDIDIHYDQNQLDDGIKQYKDERLIRVSKKKTKKTKSAIIKRNRKPTNNEYWYTGEIDKDGLSMISMYPDLYVEDEE